MKLNNQVKFILFVISVVALSILYFVWLNVVDYFFYTYLAMDKSSAIAKSLHFFVYDTVKILILLFIISSAMGIVNAYFPVEKIRILLTQKKLYGSQYLFAALFGAVTPFCSCSSIPLFIGFIKGRLPLGVTFSFLITSPLVNEVAVAMFLGLFGIKVTLIYALSGIFLGAILGFILGKFNLERYLTNWTIKIVSGSEVSNDWEENKLSFINRMPTVITESFDIVKSVVIYVIIGIGIGAVMHGYVPENFFSHFLSQDKWYAVPISVILGVPIYANAAGIVPIVQVFVTKGVPLGTAIAFMMSTVGLSIPEATLLKKVMTWRLIGIFFGAVTFSIIVLGYVFNLIL